MSGSRHPAEGLKVRQVQQKILEANSLDEVGLSLAYPQLRFDAGAYSAGNLRKLAADRAASFAAGIIFVLSAEQGAGRLVAGLHI